MYRGLETGYELDYNGKILERDSLTLGLCNEKQVITINTVKDPFIILYNTYKDIVFGHSLLFCRNIELAKDVQQEIFLRLWIHRERLDAIENIQAYLFLMARNLTLDLRQKQQREQIGKQELLRHYRQFYPPPVKNRYDEHLYESFYWQAMNSLPSSQKKIYCLVHLQQQTRKQVSAMLGITEETVKSNLRDAKRNLLRLINRHLSVTDG
jgi:RNA polymerase sigma factor (sigma-70 family)